MLGMFSRMRPAHESDFRDRADSPIGQMAIRLLLVLAVLIRLASSQDALDSNSKNVIHSQTPNRRPATAVEANTPSNDDMARNDELGTRTDEFLEHSLIDIHYQFSSIRYSKAKVSARISCTTNSMH